MSTYEVQTDGGTYQVETADDEKQPGLAKTTPSGFPEPQTSDNPEAGAEKPAEQKLAENIQTVGSGMGVPYAIEGLYGLGKSAMRGLGKALPENVPETIGRVADNQMLKSTGASMGQIKQIGPEAAREAAEVGRDAGLGDVFSTEVGREQALQNLDKTTGKAIGALREEAGNAPSDLPKSIAQKLAQKYQTGGVYSGEAGGVEKALQDVKRMSGETPLSFPTHAGNAKAATFLNDFATGNKLAQPVNAATDVANALSRENNAGIVQSLGSEKGKQYLEALSNERAYKQLEQFFTRGELREMAGRGGGKNMIQQMIQGLADKGGYRLTSKIADAIHKAMTQETSLSEVANSAGTALKGVAPKVLGGKDKEIADYLRKQFQ